MQASDLATFWLEPVLSLRDRLVASPRFRAWAASNPLTRPIARRQARSLFDVTAGFVYSQVLAACVRLQLFDVLAAGPQAVPDLARRLGLSEEATVRLMRAAGSLKLVSRRSRGRWGLGPLGAAMIGNPGIAAMVEHHALLYADLKEPLALLREEPGERQLQNYWSYARSETPSSLPAERVGAYTQLMGTSQAMISQEILAAYPLDRHRQILDVGGGDGSFLTAVAERAPHLRLTLFDLPPVAARAQQRFADKGLGERALAIGGDFLRDPLPRGADLISLVRIVHDHPDDAVMTLFRAARVALPPDGRLLIAEPMSAAPASEPATDAYFGFYLMAMGRGRPRSVPEIRTMLRRAGFARTRVVPSPTPVLARVLVAVPDHSNV
ncbi:acetylserotonin O-methyltransferase [Afifella sp. IM 167]|uniref:acetylserotonin O-methyltransferase n=1 Tax=Afifella sp. IM 167 TaxID=2033586 RepID=UPI001CCA3A19|nr:acetylserotonin O-methyltransferase [Afifella sp. IM 167]MBZ8132200.1 methyltransferase [Afifella sp. IM 167]